MDFLIELTVDCRNVWWFSEILWLFDSFCLTTEYVKIQLQFILNTIDFIDPEKPR